MTGDPSQRGAQSGLSAGIRQAGSSPAPALPGILLRPSLPAGPFPSAMVTGDFNGDGKLDWIVANALDNTLYFYAGNGDGTCQPPVIIPVLGQSPVGLATGDLNGDGILDLVVAESDSQTIGILPGNGDGTFGAESQIGFQANPLAVAIQDVSKDGIPDVLVGLEDIGTVNSYFAVLLNAGNGQLLAPIYAPNPTPGEGVAGSGFSIGDVNGDGAPDVLLTGFNADGSIVQIYLGNGDGTFTPGEQVDQSNNAIVSNDVFAAILADLTGSSCLAVVDVDTYALARIFPGDCNGGFDTLHFLTYGLGDPGAAVAVVDVNGDGYPDLVAGGFPVEFGTGYGVDTGNTLTVRLNDGTGNFGPASVYRGGSGMFALAVADFAGTAHPNIIVANQNANSLTVYTNDGTGKFGEPTGGYDGYSEGSTIVSVANPPDSTMLAADIDGDGKIDLGLVEFPAIPGDDYMITVMLNQGNGRFSIPIRSPGISSSANSLINDFVFADFRKSGRLDFLAEVSGASAPSLFYAQNLGNGRFGSMVQIPFPGQAIESFGVLGVGDFNDDGKLDFAMASSTNVPSAPVQLTVYLGNGDGTFRQPFSLQGGAANTYGESLPTAIYVSDANGDGKKDLFVWDWQSQNLYEFLGNGDGTFQPPRTILQLLSQMAMVDLNRDGHLDVVDIESSLPNSGSAPGVVPANVMVYMGQAGGTFSQPVTYVPYPGVFDASFGNNVSQDNFEMEAVLGDFNGDGNADLAIFQRQGLTFSPGFVQFMMGNGDGTFTTTNDVFPLGTEFAPDLSVPNLLGDGRSAFVQTPNLTASYQVLPSINAPSFQILFLETPVLAGQGALEITLDVPVATDTVLTLNASEAGIELPPSATIPAGMVSLIVPFTLGETVSQNRWFTITAHANNESQTVFEYPARAGIDSFSLSVGTVSGVGVQQGTASQFYSAGVQSNGNASGTFQFSCSGLPMFASCQFQYGVDTVPVLGGSFNNVLFVVAIDQSTPIGVYSFQVLATDGVSTLSATTQITVIQGPTLVSASAQQLNFGPVAVGKTSAAQSVILQSFTARDLVPITIQGPSNSSGVGRFQVVNGCANGLPPTGTCPISVSFAASQAGVTNDQFTIVGPGFHFVLSLAATADDFSLQVSAGGTTTETVNSGQSAVFNLQIAPNSFEGIVQLACISSLPVGTCRVSPLSVTVTTNSAVPFQVIVTTSSSVAGMMPLPGGFTPDRLGRLARAASLVVALAGMCLVSWLRRHSLARLTFVFVLFCCCLLAACGGSSGTSGGGGGGGGGSGAPPGTYAVQVTGMAQGVTHTMNLTVVVH